MRVRPASIPFKGRVISIIFVLAVGFISYANSFSAPFQFDEYRFLTPNPFIISGASVSSLHYDQELEKMVAHRYLVMLTFLLNYRMHGFEVEGYHVVNFVVHIISSLLVFWLVLSLFKTPFMNGAGIRYPSVSIAAFAGLIFAAHPVQTEAVTYIHQRSSSMAGMFFLLSLVLYLRWRLSPGAGSSGGRRRAWLWYAGSVLAAVCAMKSKENAFTLPFVIVLCEFLFFGGRVRPRAVRLLPVLMTLLIIPLTSFLGLDWSLERATWSGMNVTQAVSRTDYLLTQFRVIMTYLRLFFFPVNQNFLYNYPVYHSFFTFAVFASFVCLLFLFALGGYLVYLSRRGNRGLRIIAFGIFWFFMTLSVESSFIPIPALINEYRLYLPSVGFILSMVTAVFLVRERLTRAGMRFVVTACLAGIVILFSGAAYARNNIWSGKIGFWQDVLKKSPGTAAPHNYLAMEYERLGMMDRAMVEYMASLAINPADVETLLNVIMVLSEKGKQADAVALLGETFRLGPDEANEAYERIMELSGQGREQETKQFVREMQRNMLSSR